MVWSFSTGLISCGVSWLNQSNSESLTFGQPPSAWFIPWDMKSARIVFICCQCCINHQQTITNAPHLVLRLDGGALDDPGHGVPGDVLGLKLGVCPHLLHDLTWPGKWDEICQQRTSYHAGQQTAQAGWSSDSSWWCQVWFRAPSQ